MAISADIDFKWYSKIDSIHTIVEIIRVLLKFGWGFNYQGGALYLPLGDEDFDWERAGFDNDDLIEIFHKKEKSGELIGITLTWKESGVGGEFLFRQDCTFTVCLTINRQVLSEGGCTDVNWYLEKIVLAFVNSNIGIESINFSENV
ncbi:hypothetical protein OLMES_3297 [Oleiphilus messinensis]|uniref:Uncharacterized protein n=1 Tax=Oleiphilus messinensis TaxID=141451 RepID=A0A1Y0I9Z9_9GAMM|nr:hypothetical protein [Oleiphilus messinensis]ARU57338.1 hypothetical protein OLMES_3297 [Oleiphilus messinensis]